MSIILALFLATASSPAWLIEDGSDAFSDKQSVKLTTEQSGRLLMIQCNGSGDRWNVVVGVDKFVGGYPIMRKVSVRVDQGAISSPSFTATDFHMVESGQGFLSASLLGATKRAAFRIDLQSRTGGTIDVIFDASALAKTATLFKKRCAAIGASLP